MFERISMNWQFRALLALFVLSLAGGLFWLANHYHDKYLAEQKRADDAVLLAKQRQQTINDMQIRQRDVAALDAKYTKELADAKSENDALQRRLDNGGRVLVKGRCPVPAATKPASPSGLDTDAAVELSPVAGRNVLGIRAGIKEDQTKITALQQFIQDQCLKIK